MSKDSLRYIIESLVRDVNYLKCKSHQNQGGGTAGVANVNGITGGVSILPGDNVTVDTLGNNITISSTGGDVEVGFGLSKNEDGSIRLGKEIGVGSMIINNIATGDDYLVIGNVDLENNIFGNITISPGSALSISSEAQMSFTSISDMSFLSLESIIIQSDSNMVISSKNGISLRSFDEDSISIEQSIEAYRYSLRALEGVLIEYVIGNEFIEFFKRIKGIDAINPDELTTLNQVKEMIEVKDFILSPDGSKWGVTNEGTLYKLP